LGGVNAAYDGYNCLKENKSPGLIDGFTPEQRFFISWTTVWRTKSRDEAIKNQVKRTHILRVCTVRMYRLNVDAFIRHLTLKGDGMYIEPDKRVKIW
jgi:endothelin-converting enzyme/putative endopeptidase